jgi:hypothetical protein
MKLYELTGALADLSSMDMDDEAVKTTLECVQGDFNDKAVAIIKLSENLNADTSAIDAEIERLKARKQVILNRQKSLRDYLLHNMEAAGITKIECPLFTASLRKGVESVEIKNESLLPDEFVSVEVVTKPDKKAIKQAIQSGQEVPGASIKSGATTIVIK